MPSDIEKAEKLSRQQALASPILGVAVLVLHQGVFFFNGDWAAVSYVAMVLWAILALASLGLALGAGYLFVPAAVRKLANDDLTQQNRAIAVTSGFSAAMLTAILVFVVEPFAPLSAHRAAHLIFSVGVGVTLVMFGVRESKTLA